MLCLTATATPKVAQDICASFDIDAEGVFRTTTYRSNLRLVAKSFSDDMEKQEELKRFLRAHKGPSIVYVHTHEQTEWISGALRATGFDAYAYHAGLANDVRTKVQDLFMDSESIVVSDPLMQTSFMTDRDEDCGYNRLWNGHR